MDFGRRAQEDKNLAREAARSLASNNIKDEDDSSEDESGPYPQPSVPAEEWYCMGVRFDICTAWSNSGFL